MTRSLRCLLIPCLLALASMAVLPSADATVLVVRSERGVAYLDAAEAIAAELSRGTVPVAVQVLSVAELGSYAGPRVRFYAALGTEACAALARSVLTAPVLCTLLPKASFERVLRESGKRAGAAFSALYLNQPLGRQLDLVRLALPQARRVGVLWGPESQGQEMALESAAGSRGLRVVAQTVRGSDAVFTSLRKVIEDADLLLALADPQVYNASSIQNILLTSFRAQVPMLAFSPAYVRAGALMALYSTPEQIGRQAGGMVRGALQGQPIGLPQHPVDFEVSINEHVARSLGLQLDALELAARLRRLERGQ